MRWKAVVEQAAEEVEEAGAAERAEQQPVEAGSQWNSRQTRRPTTQPERIARRAVVKIGALIPQQ